LRFPYRLNTFVPELFSSVVISLCCISSRRDFPRVCDFGLRSAARDGDQLVEKGPAFVRLELSLPLPTRLNLWGKPFSGNLSKASLRGGRGPQDWHSAESCDSSRSHSNLFPCVKQESLPHHNNLSASRIHVCAAFPRDSVARPSSSENPPPPSL